MEVRCQASVLAAGRMGKQVVREQVEADRLVSQDSAHGVCNAYSAKYPHMCGTHWRPSAQGPHHIGPTKGPMDPQTTTTAHKGNITPGYALRTNPTGISRPGIRTLSGE